MSFSTSRHGHQRTRSRLTIGIPHYTNSVVDEKFHLGGSQPRPWFNPISIPLPGAHKRALRLWIPNHRRLPPSLARKRGVIALLAAFAIVLYTIFAVTVRFGSAQKKWPASPWPTPSSRATVVYHDDDLRRIWQWEVMSGHYPSRRKRTLLSILHCLSLTRRSAPGIKYYDSTDESCLASTKDF